MVKAKTLLTKKAIQLENAPIRIHLKQKMWQAATFLEEGKPIKHAEKNNIHIATYTVDRLL
jgi:hypothetical protein